MLNRVFNKMPKATAKKAKLSKATPLRVKLSAIDDLNEGIEYSNVAFDIAVEWNDDLSYEIYNKISLGYSSLELGIEKLQPALTEIDEMLNNIGIDPTENIENYDLAVRRLEYLEAVKSEYEKLLKSLEFKL